MQQKGNKVKHFWNLYKEAVVGSVTPELSWNAFPRLLLLRVLCTIKRLTICNNAISYVSFL